MLSNRIRRGHSARRMRGLSLVELLVGVTVGLFVVAAAAVLVSGQLSENRRLLLETQLQQDLRATMDVITREVRRTGRMGAPADSVPNPADSSKVGSNINALLTLPSDTHEPLQYNYRRGSGTGAFAFRWDSDGVIRACQSDTTGPTGVCSGTYQEMTDPQTVKITNFSVATVRPGLHARPNNGDAIRLPCPNLCADGSTDCWPTVQARELVITITGQSRNYETVVRTLSSSVRLRNDLVTLSDEAPAGQACPI